MLRSITSRQLLPLVARQTLPNRYPTLSFSTSSISSSQPFSTSLRSRIRSTPSLLSARSFSTGYAFLSLSSPFLHSFAKPPSLSRNLVIYPINPIPEPPMPQWTPSPITSKIISIHSHPTSLNNTI